MVDEQLAGRGITDERVLEAMGRVPRELFVGDRDRRKAYRDMPLPIGHGQTISQPYMVAVICQAAEVREGDSLLDIGTGSGYQAAVLAELGANVHTIERIPELAERARARLTEAGYENVDVHVGDGSLGVPEHAPYDAIVVTAGGPEVPRSLRQQLAIGGRLVMPVGPTSRSQRLVRVVRTGEEIYDRETLEDVCFVPLIGAEGWPASEGWM